MSVNAKLYESGGWVWFVSALALLLSSSLSLQAQPCDAPRIVWSPEVRIGIGDFQARPGTPDHTAEANTGIATNSHAGTDPNTFIVEAETFFNPCKSWFRRTTSDSATLAHERLHFDITELYARRLMARYASEIANHRQFLAKHERLYNQVWEEARRKQQAYDREVYADRSRQQWWGTWVAEQLAKTSSFAEKRIELPMAR